MSYVSFCPSLILYKFIAASKYAIKPLYSFVSPLNFGISNFGNPMITIFLCVSLLSLKSFLAAHSVSASDFNYLINFSIISISLCRWWFSNYYKLHHSSCFWMLTGCIFRIDLMIRLKSGRNPFLDQNWVHKPQNYPKSISREPLFLKSLLTSQNDCKTWFTMSIFRYVYPSDNRKCPNYTFFFCFWEPYN